MRKIVSMLSLIVLLLSFSASSVLAIPTHDPVHPHIAATVHWGDVTGVGAHNHRLDRSFDNDPIYDANKVWDCRQLRLDWVGGFDRGHGFINEFPNLGGGPDHIPRYRFHNVGGNDPDPTGGAWPAAAQVAIRNAFSQWSAIVSDRPGHVVGLHFTEVASDAAAEITIHWHNIDFLGETSPADPAPGELRWDRPNGAPVTIVFDSTPPVPWFYGAQALTPIGNYHFLSTALHETGHAVGLQDQNDYDDVMIGARNSGPNDPINQRTGPAFDVIDDDSIEGARDLYMIELTHEQAALLKSATTDAAPRVAPVNTPATITITNTGPMPIEVYGWEVTRPDGVVDAVVFAPREVKPGETVEVTVYRGCGTPGVYRYRVFWDPVSEGTFERYSYAVGGFSVSIDIPVDKPTTLLAPYIGLASTILVATAVTAVYVKRVKRGKKKQ